MNSIVVPSIYPCYHRGIANAAFVKCFDPVSADVMRIASNAVGRCLLAIVVLPSSGGTFAFHHAHAGGDKSHNHFHTVEGICSDHCCELPVNASVARKTLLISGCVAHTHILWFGFTITLPSDPGPRGADNQLLSGLGFQFVPLNGESALNVIVDNVARSLLVVQHHGVPPPADVEDSAAHAYIRPAISTPLCDTARHERSGVQLI